MKAKKKLFQKTVFARHLRCAAQYEHGATSGVLRSQR